MAIKKSLILLLLYSQYIHAQELTATAENQLENHMAIPDDDAQLQLLNGYTRHKISLNTADAAALQSLGLLSPLQITNFMLYRQLLGKLLSIYELQAIPGFDAALIRSLLPYVQVGEDLQPHHTLKDYTHNGDHAFLCRYNNPGKLLLRYRYNYPNYISWGMLTEKDAGERLFDFNSAHLFVKNYKHIKALALGDFTVNMGQGLINWQTLALGKGPAVMQIKRESDLLRPYASAGEFYFYRGAGITIQHDNWQGTAFISLRQLDGTIDTLLASLYSSGYHRTDTERKKRNAIQQFTTGGNLSFIKQNWHAGINIIRHHYSVPLQKDNKPYNLFAFSGTQLTNASIDYAATWKNLHFFGEIAISDNLKTGMVHGILASVAKNADISILYRHYNQAYQSMYNNAFGEYYKAVNERGLYTAIALKITPYLIVNGYADVFSFPWLSYSINTPANGKEVLLSLTYTPDKHTEAFIRYSYSTKQQKENDNNFIKWPVQVKKQSWRCQTTMQLKEGLIIKSRVEVNRSANQQGFLLFLDAAYQLPKTSFTFSGRYITFVTGGTATTMYVITSGILYEYMLSQLYGRGCQYQLCTRWRLMPRLSLWARFQQTVYSAFASEQSNKNVITLQMQQLF
ncbi:hypothetical protein GO495_02090 [Chitinophaga oryziterrae]|uniref:Helix-hairpin-helix domain-containing protein n=1 Tax=Chitinophaga oryziterrae TaxID=1031224 RepID=A0A6N8J2U8_9BACT|nr:helix-hairpin-helix domain-containing protein [Chitinophaga oryziterrae]MVT39363.1 hypothetical protein [Chitinophaga oryziterrae]